MAASPPETGLPFWPLRGEGKVLAKSGGKPQESRKKGCLDNWHINLRDCLIRFFGGGYWTARLTEKQQRRAGGKN
jgi:hypothetical protein